VDDLFAVIRALRDNGVAIIIITHKLEEVMDIADRVYILRRGNLVGERRIGGVTKEELANLMVGRDVVLTVHREAKARGKNPILEIHDLSTLSDRNLPALRSLSLSVFPGEIVGIAGVDGNGQSELAEVLMGLRPAESGRIVYKGEDITGETTKERILKKISYVPSDRQRFGLVLPMLISENLVIGSHDRKPFSRGINLNLKDIDRYSKTLVEDFDIRTPSVQIPASTLSGGNQQKVILARELSREPDFLLVSQPTRGVDVGAIEYIHNRILAMRERNVAVLLISLELEEIFALSDRILVLFEGRIVQELVPEKTTEKEVGFFMTSGKGRSDS
jgi:simple sugar transport system ATP-binding protein